MVEIVVWLKADFIERWHGVADGQERTCSSVFKDGNGNIYSYGYHYPLLFEAGGPTFRNRVGYSSTTAKHIAWTQGVFAIDVWVSGCNQYTWRNPENVSKLPHLLYMQRYGGVSDQDILQAVLSDLEDELKDINGRIATKKRTNTKIYQSLLEERKDCVDRIGGVRPYVKAVA